MAPIVELAHMQGLSRQISVDLVENWHVSSGHSLYRSYYKVFFLYGKSYFQILDDNKTEVIHKLCLFVHILLKASRRKPNAAFDVNYLLSH